MNTEESSWKEFTWYKFRTGTPKGKTRKILYLHGGGFILNSGVAQFAFAEYLANATGAEIWFPEYPIIPENNGVVALEMTMELYRKMLQECTGNEIAIGGDSAGGGLALSAALQIAAEGYEAPNNLFLISPACGGHGLPRNAEEKSFEEMLLERDPVVSTKAFPTIARMWAGPLSADDWRVNPIKGDLKSLPPMLIFAGGAEAMEMGIRQFVEETMRQQADSVYYVRNGKGHDYVLFDADTVEERRMIVDRLL